MDVFGLRGAGYDGCADLGVGGFVINLAAGGADAMGPVLGFFGDSVQTIEGLGEFVSGEDVCGGDGAGVGLGGGDLVGEEAPVEGEAALPLLKGAVEWLAEAA